MTQHDLEKAYTEAVDQLARAVEANRLLTERLKFHETQFCDLRILQSDLQRGMETAVMAAEEMRAILDRHPAPSQDE